MLDRPQCQLHGKSSKNQILAELCEKVVAYKCRTRLRATLSISVWPRNRQASSQAGNQSISQSFAAAAAAPSV